MQLRREGREVNHKKTHRIYRELGLLLRNKTPKRPRKAKLREDRRNPAVANKTWAMDFVHDQLAPGRKLRVLMIVDAFSQFCSAVDPRFSHRGEDVVRTLDAVCAEIGHPKTIRVDNGSEFVSRDLDLRACDTASCSTSRGPESRWTRRSSRRSIRSSARSACRRIGF